MIKYIEHAFITSGGTVFEFKNGMFTYVSNTHIDVCLSKKNYAELYSDRCYSPEKSLELIKSQIQSNKIITLNSGPYFHIIPPFNGYIYGHLFDQLQFIKMKLDNNLSNITYLGGVKNGSCNEIEKHIKILDSDCIIEFCNKISTTVYEVHNVYVPLVNETFEVLQYADDMFDWIKSKYDVFSKTLNITTKSNRKIFLDRNTKSRKIINYDEVINKLKSENYDIISNFETLKLEEVAKLFIESDTIMAVHGGALLNCIFCNNKNIIEYCPKNRHGSFFKKMFERYNNYMYVEVDADKNYDILLKV